MDAVIVANGELQASARLQHVWERADLRIAANGGARNAREHLGRAPQVMIGDLDSLDSITRAWLEDHAVEFIQHPVAKDETDLELALNLADARGATRLTVLAPFGGRIDQFLGNILLLTQRRSLLLMDATGEMWAAEGQATIDGQVGDTVSLLPLDPQVEGIVTQDLRYPLQHETLGRGTTRGISNQLTAPHASVRWERGLLVVVHLFDRGRLA